MLFSYIRQQKKCKNRCAIAVKETKAVYRATDLT